MRISPLAAIAALSLGVALASTAVAQLNTTHHKKTSGYMDEHGVFHTFAHPDPDLYTNATHAGKFVINYNVKIETSLPSGSTIYCSADIFVDSEQTVATTTAPYEAITDISYEEEGEGSVAAGAVGSTVSCQVVINYSWSFPGAHPVPPTTPPPYDSVVNSIQGSYSVGAIKSTTGTTILTLDGTRVSTSDLTITGVPAANATTTLTVPVTL